MPLSPLLKKLPRTEGEWFEALIELTRYLRSSDGCPWDREHSAIDFAEFAKGELQEFCEALAACNNTHAEEEFGDCLFVLLSSMAAAEAESRFTLSGALQKAYEKMIRRHTHVFSANRAATPEEAMASWKAIKAKEKMENVQGETSK